MIKVTVHGLTGLRQGGFIPFRCRYPGKEGPGRFIIGNGSGRLLVSDDLKFKKNEFFIKGERDPGISRDPYRIETVISDPILKFRHRFRPDQ